MKIEFNEQDITSAELRKKRENHHHLILIGKDSQKCSLELKVTDPYKCDVFLTELFYSLKDYTKENCGFEVSAVSLLGVYSDLNNLSDGLHKAIDEALDKHNLYNV